MNQGNPAPACPPGFVPASGGASEGNGGPTEASGALGLRDLRGARFVGRDLRGQNFTGADLSGADLSEADLSGCDLSRCDLRGAVLHGATLDGCELLGANLSRANLSECRARRAGFGHTDLSGANLFGSDLGAATFLGADLTGANLGAARLDGARLREAKLAGADFTRARLRGADLGKSDVTRAVFQNADLRAARLRALQGFQTATWVGTDLRHVDFTGAYLLRRFILDENYLFEFRTQSRYTRFLYTLWWLSSDCGRSLWRWLAWNLALAVLFACLYAGVEMDYGSHPTPLSALYYSVVTLTTLGYGDVVPASQAGQVLAMAEVFLGYLGLGGLLSILANKMARRAD